MPIEKSDDQIARDKAAVLAMKNAQSHMTTAINRVATLELALNRAVTAISNFKGYVGKSAYCYESRTSCHEKMQESIDEINKFLGAQ